jgi:hypothetical protein
MACEEAGSFVMDRLLLALCGHHHSRSSSDNLRKGGAIAGGERKEVNETTTNDMGRLTRTSPAAAVFKTSSHRRSIDSSLLNTPVLPIKETKICFIYIESEVRAWYYPGYSCMN